jgi:hypothetical protein
MTLLHKYPVKDMSAVHEMLSAIIKCTLKLPPQNSSGSFASEADVHVVFSRLVLALQSGVRV